MGRSLDMLENRTEAIKALISALVLDPLTMEAAEYLVNRNLLTQQEKRNLFGRLNFTGDNDYLKIYYR